MSTDVDTICKEWGSFDNQIKHRFKNYLRDQKARSIDK
jgi:hypothetical protein